MNTFHIVTIGMNLFSSLLSFNTLFPYYCYTLWRTISLPILYKQNQMMNPWEVFFLLWLTFNSSYWDKQRPKPRRRQPQGSLFGPTLHNLTMLPLRLSLLSLLSLKNSANISGWFEKEEIVLYMLHYSLLIASDISHFLATTILLHRHCRFRETF